MPPSGMTLLIALGGLCSLFAGVQPRADILKDVTLGFGEALKHCRDESQLTEEQMEEFFHIWRDDFVFEHRELGCAIYCMSRYFNLLTDTNRAHHENIHKFIESFENGEVLAKRMVEIIHECERKFDHEDDHCWRILHMSECFKTTVIAEGIAPSIEMILAEIIMEADGGK